MDNDHTQYQNSTNASDDQDEKVQGEKLKHNDQLESNGLEGEPVDTGQENVSVVQGKSKKKTSVPFWRLVSVHSIE